GWAGAPAFRVSRRAAGRDEDRPLLGVRDRRPQASVPGREQRRTGVLRGGAGSGGAGRMPVASRQGWRGGNDGPGRPWARIGGGALREGETRGGAQAQKPRKYPLSAR